MIDSIRKIERYTEGLTYRQFAESEEKVDAVLRNIAVIGEAAREVPGDVQARHSQIPWNELRMIRNVVVHEYFGLDLGILWKTTQDDLPDLLPRLKRLLDRERRN
ncbi:MAG: DUF86 domain-containing protein [Dehalococcoidia bacterium]